MDIDKVNEELIRENWLKWVNQARKSSNLEIYQYNYDIEYPALLWSEKAVKLGTITHQRETKNYYNYHEILSWFKKLGYEFNPKNNVTVVENIGWGYYKCNDDDCTEELTKSIKTTFDFFISEKNRKYRPHYDSIMNPNYNYASIGIAIDKATNKYYLTTYYFTKLK